MKRRGNQPSRFGTSFAQEVLSFGLSGLFNVASNPTGARTLEIEFIHNLESFRAVKPDWELLAREPLSSWEWNYWWWQHMASSNQRLCVMVARDRGVVVGIAPFMLESRVGEKCLRFIASGKTCTDYASLISTEAYQTQFVDLVVSALQDAEGFLHGVGLVELEGKFDDRAIDQLAESLDAEYWTYQKSNESSWYIQLPGSWDAFSRSTRSSFRRKVRKAEKRIKLGEITIRSTTNDLDFDVAFDRLVELHQQRQSSKGEAGVFSDARFTRFLHAATSALAQRDGAEIVMAEKDGVALGAQLYLVGAKGLQLYQSGMCQSGHRLEIGHLLFTHLIERSIREGMPIFDFLRGDEQYKQSWGAIPIPLQTMRCVSRSLSTSLKHQTIRSLRSVKAIGQAVRTQELWSV